MIAEGQIDDRIEMGAPGCPICYNDLGTGNTMRFECGHACCSDCWENIISTANSEFKKLDELKCFDPKCLKKIQDIEAKVGTIRNEEVKKRFRYLQKRQEIHKDRNKYICPNENCMKVLNTDDQKEVKKK